MGIRTEIAGLKPEIEVGNERRAGKRLRAQTCEIVREENEPSGGENLAQNK